MESNARHTWVWLTIGLISLYMLSAPAPGFAAETTATGEKATEANQPAAPRTLQPKVQDLGNDRYRIGMIEVDKAQRRFRIPGAVLREEPPLEFFAVTTGGLKKYESLIELGASAYEINLACILIGLESDQAVPSQHHFDPKPVEGDPVDIWLEWTLEGETTRVDAAELLRVGDEAVAQRQWIYTGSIVTPDGQYLAHLDGTVVGFVHDPSSIFEHRTGIGLGNFGAITANRELLPPVSSRVTMIVAPRDEPSPAETGSAPE